MDGKNKKELGLMLAAGAVMGILFSTAIAGNPLELGGFLGGILVGALMFILS